MILTCSVVEYFISSLVILLKRYCDSHPEPIFPSVIFVAHRDFRGSQANMAGEVEKSRGHSRIHRARQSRVCIGIDNISRRQFPGWQ